MTNEQLRMQMLSGIITEGEYKAKLEEASATTKFLRKLGWAGEDLTPKELAAKIKKLSDDTLIAWSKDKNGIPNTPLAFQQKLVKIEMDKRGLKESLNESMIGGIVGIGSINQIPATPKTDYELAYEHFLGERYEVKPNRERDDIKDINEEDEVEEGNLGHNEMSSLTPEGRFWIVSWRGMDGPKEKVFTDEDEARAFMNTLEEGKEVEEPNNY